MGCHCLLRLGTSRFQLRSFFNNRQFRGISMVIVEGLREKIRVRHWLRGKYVKSIVVMRAEKLMNDLKGLASGQ